jgi:hypothetical protein
MSKVYLTVHGKLILEEDVANQILDLIRNNCKEYSYEVGEQ